MKKIGFLLLLIPLVITNSYSQNNEGVVSYTVKQVNKNAEKTREFLKKRDKNTDIIKDVFENEVTLYFTKDQSLYKQKERASSSNRRTRFEIFLNKKVESYFRDITNNLKIQERSILDKSFIIIDKEPKLKWKITGKTEQLGNYQVMEATTTYEGSSVQAWFTPQIPISTGPGPFSQLPGLILRLEIDQGNQLIFANKIELRPLTKEETFKKPTGGKQVTEEEFLAIRKEKKEEITDLYGKERAAELLSF